MSAPTSNSLWILELRGTLLTPLMARNALKSNVTWTSYPFVPPTGSSGFFADLLSKFKWYEANDNRVRHLHELADYQGVFALGAYPQYGQMSRRHFRAHLGSLSFNYEAYIWSAGRNEGKKLAVIEEFLTDELRFVVIAREPEPLSRLHQAVRGQIAPLAKKGSVQLEFYAEPTLTHMKKDAATGEERASTMVPFMEIGNLPDGLVPYLVPLRSEGTSQGIRWHTEYCTWHTQLQFREGVAIYKSRDAGISSRLLEQVGVFS
ncbi:MAG: hypothetical protein AB7G75_18580 [Candidatus Binatia bacterium]